MEYTIRLAVFIPQEKLAEATELAIAVFGDEPEFAPKNFSIPIEGGLLAGTGVMTEEQLATAFGFLPSVPWVVMFIWSAETGQLIDATQHWADGLYGEPWGWQECLDRLNVQVLA